MKLLKTLENEGATSKYPEYIDIKVSGHILEVFVALKNIFFSDQSCLFSATVVLHQWSGVAFLGPFSSRPLLRCLFPALPTVTKVQCALVGLDRIGWIRLRQAMLDCVKAKVGLCQTSVKLGRLCLVQF